MPNEPALANATQSFKENLRRQMRRHRRQLTATQRLYLEGSINRHLLRWLCGRPEHHIAAYWPVRGETDIRPALRELSSSGREVYLPGVDEEQHGLMRFAPWDPQASLPRLNRYGIPEPELTHVVDAAALDLILAPLVAFCPQGGRLGAGAGYYDRACARLDRQHTWLIGIAFSFQEVENLPLEPWDIPLDGVFTEHGLMACNPRLEATLAPPLNDQEHDEWPTG